jgi:hypothetical protein
MTPSTARWDEVVRRIVEATNSVRGGISIRGPRDALDRIMQLDPACGASYANHYHKLNPFEALAAESGPLRIFRWLAILKSQKFKMNSAALSGGRNSSRPVCHVQPMRQHK